MKKSNLEKVRAIVKELGEGYSVYENYSGRGMYGAKCIGIVGPSFTEITAVTGKHGIRRASTDNMGRDYIVYWPNMK